LGEIVVIFSDYEYPSSLFHLSNKSVVIDAGANIGAFSLFVQKKFNVKKIYCIEPFKPNFVQLKKNLKINHLEQACKPSLLALGDKNKDVFLQTGLLEDSVYVTKVNTGLIASQIKISTFCRLNSIQHIDLLKLDVEGAEYCILNEDIKFLSKHVAQIILEYHTVPGKNGLSIISNMVRNYFHCILIEDGHLFLINKSFFRDISVSGAKSKTFTWG